jgi:predicted nucleic acid-binding protein
VRIVADTNLLVSYLILRQSTPGKAVDRVLSREQILVSNDTMFELSEVLTNASQIQ